MDVAEIVAGRADWIGRPSTEALKRRESLLNAMSPDKKRLLSDMIGVARAGREGLLQSYAHSLLDSLMTESHGGASLRPRRLLEFAACPGNDVMDHRSRFEAISLFDIALLQQWLEHEPSSSRYVVGEDITDLLDELVRTFFIPGTRDVKVRTLHDPDDHFRVSQIAFGGEELQSHSEYVRVHPMTFRLAQNDLLVLVDHRPKGLFESILKMFKQLDAGVQDWYKVYDRRGFRMVVQTREDVDRLFRALEVFASLLEAEFVRVGGNITEPDAKMKRDNVQSHARFKADKVRIVWRGQPYEFQVMVAQDYISSKFALDGENHDLYRLRQLADCYGELLWPRALYGIEWKIEAGPGGPLHQQALAKLNWRTTRHR